MSMSATSATFHVNLKHAAARRADTARMNPTNPIAAVTHRDPYPYYSTLVDGPPLAFDASLGLWVASRAASVSKPPFGAYTNGS